MCSIHNMCYTSRPGCSFKPLTVCVAQNNGTVFTELLTELFKSSAPTQQDAVGGNQPKIFASISKNPNSHSSTQVSVWLVQTAKSPPTSNVHKLSICCADVYQTVG